MTTSTLELSTRLGRQHAVPRAKGRPPEHVVPFALVAVVTAYVLLFVPPGRLNYGEVSAALAIGAALLGLALMWPTVPRIATLGVPIAYIALASLLRDAAGGGTSGFGGLFLLPVLWLALTAGRRELTAILAVMGIAQAVPLAFVGGAAYPQSGWRGAFVLTTVAAITGLMVQRLIAETRRRAALLEEQKESLTRVSAQLAEQNERLRELDRLKDEFVATASHELRTPLTSITGYLEMSLDSAEGPLSPAQEAHLRIVQRNADRLTTLVDQLLFLARADSHPLELDREPVDLAGLLEEAAETARPAAQARDIAVLVDVETPHQVMADRSQLLRVVENLLTNAVKFSLDGGTVSLSVRAGGASSVVEVADTGVGIPTAEQADLFKRFFRGTTALHKAVPGSGLGLAISQVIAEAHGTTIEVESTPGAGSTFRLALPHA